MELPSDCSLRISLQKAPVTQTREVALRLSFVAAQQTAVLIALLFFLFVLDCLKRRNW